MRRRKLSIQCKPLGQVRYPNIHFKMPYTSKTVEVLENIKKLTTELEADELEVYLIC